MQKLVGTKILAIVEDEDYGAIFYDGIIKSIEPSKMNDVYNITALLKPAYGTDKNAELMNITVDLRTSSYRDDELALDGKTDDGKNVNIKISNKKARLAIASLLNRKGNDEFLKKI